MVDITHKHTTLREATASATVVVGSAATIEAVREGRVPKGDVLEAARTAGLFGVKKTAEIIPDCHPLPVEHARIDFELRETEIEVRVFVKTIYRTGVEVEAMHGASVVALTIYDMLKPIDRDVHLRDVRLVEKRGGKSDYRVRPDASFQAAVVVCSDTVAAGEKEDRAGRALLEKLEAHGVQHAEYVVVPDEEAAIRQAVQGFCESGCGLILTCGGTGLSPRDVTPEAVRPLFDREIPGIAEAVRTYGQARTPMAMLSRGVAGVAGETLIVTLPGSTQGATESLDAVFPSVLHVFSVLRGGGHGDVEP